MRDASYLSQTDMQALLPDARDALGLPDDEFVHDLGTIEPRDAIAAQRA